ncbi:biogenesis of lysosome-related organelles complex 1 subunit 6-like [Clytia hemisphaerica]|uniref:Biogenesis of lysosome-related organelles complex 1 subunit 6 n=1 Tax=Clytia hemisphaerica TaxID=252671 RepID=A0A7M5VB58_9CNID|eukprot:TCONS_00000658-protein
MESSHNSTATDASGNENEIPPCLESSKELSKGVLELYQNDLKPVQDNVTELLRNQGVLRDITQNEITQVKENIMLAEITDTFETMKLYQKKLVAMKKEMNNLTSRIDKFKIRAQKLQLQKEREELESAKEKERQRKYERDLTAKPAQSTGATSK